MSGTGISPISAVIDNDKTEVLVPLRARSRRWARPYGNCWRESTHGCGILSVLPGSSKVCQEPNDPCSSVAANRASLPKNQVLALRPLTGYTRRLSIPPP